MGIISNEHDRAKKDGALEAYKPKNYDKVDKKFKDTEDDISWVGMSVPETAIVVNYKELKKLGIDIPKVMKI